MSIDIPMEHSLTDWPSRVPAPSHRHAAPSGPWPWQDLDDSIPEAEPADGSSTQSHRESGAPHWSNYPECLFPNWKADQVERSKMKTSLPASGKTLVYHVDVAADGEFSDQGSHLVQDEEEFEDAMAETVSRRRFLLLLIHFKSRNLWNTSVFVHSLSITCRGT
jgi:hypothetical protein